MHTIIPTTTNRDQVPAALDAPGGNTLRPAQMVEMEHEMKLAEQQLQDPRVQDKGAVRMRLNNLRKNYEQQAPRPITDGALKDKLAKEAEALLESILPGMLSSEEMRKNPAGSVDKHLRWERANKRKILRWKKLQTVLNADTASPATWDRDAANLERFRPHGAQDRFRSDAQISGLMSYGTVSEAQWNQAFHGVGPNSALKQAEKVSQFSEQEQAVAKAVIEKTAPETAPSSGVATESVQTKRK